MPEYKSIKFNKALSRIVILSALILFILFSFVIPQKAHAEDKTKAVLMFTGDSMCLAGQQYSAEIKGGYDFYPSYKYVAKLFKKADFVCGNLETLISESNPITKSQKTINGQPQCNGPIQYLDAIQKAGYNAVVTANNHCCDWGPVGIEETKKHLDEYNILNVGTNYRDKQVKYILTDVNGINVAVLSYTHLVNQRGKMTKNELTTMVNCYDEKTVKADIKAAKKAGAEYVVVYCHWGSENTEELAWYQKNDAKAVANAGADLIIGSHPHCLQRAEYITTDDKREVLCMYSMGNFVSSMSRDINNDTIILAIDLEKTTYYQYPGGPKAISVISTKKAGYIPCRVTTIKGNNNVIFPVSAEINGGNNSASLKEAGNRIKKVIKNLSEYRFSAKK